MDTFVFMSGSGIAAPAYEMKGVRNEWVRKDYTLNTK